MDLSSILGMIGMGGGPAGATGGNLPLGGGGAAPTTGGAPLGGLLSGLFGGGAPNPAGSPPGGLFGTGYAGPLNAATNMLQASGPSRMPNGLGQIMGSGIGGFLQGNQLDQQNALQQQQQSALQRISDKLMGTGGMQGGTQPLGAPVAGGMTSMPNMQPPTAAPHPALPTQANPPQVPGAAPVPGINIPPGSPYIQMMMRQRGLGRGA